MSETGKISEAEPAKVLATIPTECLPMLKDITKFVDPRFQSLVDHVLNIVPRDILQSIINSEPTSTSKIIECIDTRTVNVTHVRYGLLMKRWPTPECLKDVKWQEKMGPLRDQKEHDVCWAIVVSELIRAVRQIEGRDEDPSIIYSPQDLIDFTDRVKRSEMRKLGHYCYPGNLTNGFMYVMENGLLWEIDRPFNGCPKDVSDRASFRFGYIKGYVKLDTIEKALNHLEHRPIGAALALFHPEYKTIGTKVYRGPANHKSFFCGLHAVSLMAVGEEKGEKYVLARASHGSTFGDGGYIKISLEAMVVYIPTPGEGINLTLQNYFGKPNYLLRRFSYPTLLTKDEEEIKIKMHQNKLMDESLAYKSETDKVKVSDRKMDEKPKF